MNRSILRRTGAVAAAVVALTLIPSLAPAGIAGVDAAHAVTGATVSSAVTTIDRSRLLAQGASPTFDSATPAVSGQDITVDTSRTFQTMDGFGASLTDSSAALLYRLSPAQRDEVMRSIFSPTEGIGMSWLRQPIGSSDFVDEPHYTYNDIPANETDYNQTRFSIAHDESQILPLLRRAIQLNPGLKVMASPWGQPAWMKANASLIGGRLKDDPLVYRAYALYLLKFIQAYQAAGVPIYGLTVQNEPQNRRPDAYPGTDMPVAQQAAVINELGPLLRDNGLGAVKIMSFDHNWEIFPSDATTAPPGADPERNYASDILRTPAAQWIAGTAYHCYYGDASAQSRLKDAFPTKDIWFTECSGFRGNADSDAKAFADTLKFHAKNVGIATTRNWARAVTNWNLALDGAGKPANGGCGNSPDGFCTGVVEIDGSTITRNAEYYHLGHFSKFVKPGALRVATENAGDIHNVAFRNPDGSVALVAHNIGGGDQTFSVNQNGLRIRYALPAGAAATLTWTPGTAPAPDTSAPSVPAGLAASDTTQTSTRVSWNASTDNVGVTGYTVFRNGAEVGAVSGTSFTDSGLSASTTYSYTIRARDAAGNTSALSSALSVTTQSVQPPTGAIDSTKWYQVINRNSAKCLDVADFGTGNGTALQQWTCNTPTATNQQWQFRAVGNGSYQVVSRFTPLSWDVAGGPGATGNGATVHLWTYGGGSNQQWRATDLGGGWFQFQAGNSGKCLDVRDVSTADGARLQQWECSGGPAQSFRLAG